MESLLDYYKNIALSDKDILRLVGNRANIILYPDLHKYNTLDQILDPYDACVLLYEAKPRFGHWCCLLKTYDINGALIEFFDQIGRAHV